VHHVEPDDQGVGGRLGECVRRATVAGADVDDDLTSGVPEDVGLGVGQVDELLPSHDAHVSDRSHRIALTPSSF